MGQRIAFWETKELKMQADRESGARYNNLAKKLQTWARLTVWSAGKSRNWGRQLFATVYKSCTSCRHDWPIQAMDCRSSLFCISLNPSTCTDRTDRI